MIHKTTRNGGRALGKTAVKGGSPDRPIVGKRFLWRMPPRMLGLSIGLVIALSGGGSVQAVAESNICDLPADERPDPLPEPLSLCGRTTLEGDQTGVFAVHVPEEVQISEDFSPEGSIQIEGAGDFVGFALVEDTPGYDGFNLIAGRLPGSAGSIFLGGGGGICSPCTLEPGPYLIYLLADSSPATVTLRFPSLEGNVEVTDLHPVVSESRVLTPRIDPSPAQQVRTWGDSADLGSTGLLLTVVWSRSSPHAVGHQRICVHQGTPLAYPPECDPRDFIQEGNFVSPTTGSFFQRTYGTTVRVAGTYGLQGSIAVAGNVTEANSLGVWLSFEADASD